MEGRVGCIGGCIECIEGRIGCIGGCIECIGGRVGSARLFRYQH